MDRLNRPTSGLTKKGLPNLEAGRSSPVAVGLNLFQNFKHLPLCNIGRFVEVDRRFVLWRLIRVVSRYVGVVAVT